MVRKTLLVFLKSKLIVICSMSLFLCVLSLLSSAQLCRNKVIHMTNISELGGNRFAGHFVFPVHGQEIEGWEVTVTFSEPVTGFSEWMGDIIKNSMNNKTFVLVNKPHTGIQKDGQTLDITVQWQAIGQMPQSGTAELVNLGHDNFTVPPVPNHDGTKYNYDEVLLKSIMFYEAQRSGKLPADNRIVWRRDSALKDSGNNGEDLTGGWYDAGDNVKFGFPMSASTTMLAWGLLRYKDAYEKSGQLEKMYECLRWPLEWFLKCHTGPAELYIQVGDGEKDHAFWGRAEDMDMERPAFKVNATHPGSDVAGEYAAAMAAGYLVFKYKDPGFAARLLTHAKQINDFAVSYKGIYTDSVKAAAAYYRSSKYEDELTEAGAWLYKATNDSSYLQQAETFYQSGPRPSSGQSWNHKNTGNMIMLYEMTGKDKYKQAIMSTFTDWLPGGKIPYSPKGLSVGSKWGSLRHAANMAFMALLAADDGIHTDEYRSWAKSQIHFALGDSGRSFVVGFGKKSPERVHHRGASCPLIPAPCGFEYRQNNGPNPHVLYGGLVGGPDENGSYTDDRGNYVSNEVACDYNAGFQSAVAGLKTLFLSGY